MAHNHNPAYANPMIGNSGQHQGSIDFTNRYNLVVPFDITCALCCVTYLIDIRGYQQFVGMMDLCERLLLFLMIIGLARVSYSVGANISCEVDGPRGHRGVHGLVVTGTDPNIGALGARPVNASHSYQFYLGNPGGLAMGAILVARIEAIAVNQIRNRAKLHGCYFNFCDAALLELWRVQQGRGSLNGFCCLPSEEQINVAQSADSDSEQDEIDDQFLTELKRGLLITKK